MDLVQRGQGLDWTRIAMSCGYYDQAHFNHAGSFGINYPFEQRPLRLFLSTGGYHTLQYTLIGLVLGLWHQAAYIYI